MSEVELSKDGQALVLVLTAIPIGCIGFLIGWYSYVLMPGSPEWMSPALGFAILFTMPLMILKMLNDIYNGPEYITVPVSKIQPLNQGTVELYVTMTKDEYDGLFRHTEYTPEQKEKLRRYFEGE